MVILIGSDDNINVVMMTKLNRWQPKYFQVPHKAEISLNQFPPNKNTNQEADKGKENIANEEKRRKDALLVRCRCMVWL